MALALAVALVGPGPPSTRAAGPGPGTGSRAGTAARTPKHPTIYHKYRNFRVPFNVDPEDRPRIKEVQLWVSEDSGYNWNRVSGTTPDRPIFSFRAARDGEYWFAVRTLDAKGKLFPGKDEPVEPNMRVIVDTTPPSLVLEPDGRRGSLASVRWDVKDENLDPKSLVLEYQVEGARDWRTLPIHRWGLIGSESWDAGTAEPLKVRGSVADKAGNIAEAVIGLGEGTPSNPGVAAADTAEFASPPPISQISSGPTPSTRGGGPAAARPATDVFPPAEENQPPALPTSPVSGSNAFVPEADPFASAPGPAPAGNDTVAGAPPSAAAAAGVGPGPTQLVPSPRFPLQYAVDDAGPSGPAKVELWVTQDGGRSWFLKGEDPDRTSPFPVDLGGEGTFGLRLVARAASGLGDTPPGPGDPPHLTVEVDSTPPTVQILPPVVGTGVHAGKVLVKWRASDVHLGPKAASLSWRPEQAGARWQMIAEGLDGNGQFVWAVPPTVPPRFHLRVDVLDDAGNRGFAETTEGSPVYLDRTRPRTRILGLDPSARTGMRPGAASIR